MAETWLCSNVEIIIHQSKSEEVQNINNKITDKKSSEIIVANHYYVQYFLANHLCLRNRGDHIRWYQNKILFSAINKN
jgi:hypothetical protein